MTEPGTHSTAPDYVPTLEARCARLARVADAAMRYRIPDWVLRQSMRNQAKADAYTASFNAIHEALAALHPTDIDETGGDHG